MNGIVVTMHGRAAGGKLHLVSQLSFHWLRRGHTLMIDLRAGVSRIGLAELARRIKIRSNDDLRGRLYPF